MSVAICPHCRMRLACEHCRNFLSAEDIEDINGPPLHGEPTGEARGSSGREAWTPRARADYLASIGTRARSEIAASVAADESSDCPTFIRRVADSERLVKVCEQDSDDAHATWRELQADAPEFVGSRALTDEAYAKWQAACQAQAAAVTADTALERARLRLSRELEAFERVAAPPPAWAFDDSPGLTAIDRDRR